MLNHIDVDPTPKKATECDLAVGERIARLRRSAGLSQTALAGSIGVSFQQLQKYEKGRNRVGASRLQAIASHLGVPVATLFGGEATSQAAPRPIDDLMVGGALELLRLYAAIGDADGRRAVLEIVRSAARVTSHADASGKKTTD